MEQIKNNITWYYIFGIRQEIVKDKIIKTIDGFFEYSSIDIKNINFLKQDKLIKDMKGEKWKINNYNYPDEWVKSYTEFNTFLSIIKVRKTCNPITYHLINSVERLDIKDIEYLANAMDYKQRDKCLFKL